MNLGVTAAERQRRTILLRDAVTAFVAAGALTIVIRASNLWAPTFSFEGLIVIANRPLWALWAVSRASLWPSR